jgi:hypothetical protein
MALDRLWNNRPNFDAKESGMTRSRRNPSRSLFASALVAVAVSGALFASRPEARQPEARQFPLESATGLRLNDLTAEPATLQGRKGLRLTISDDTRRRLGLDANVEQVAALDGLEFANGIIEAELAGEPAPGAGEGARGFVGIAFRVQNDLKTYDAFYLRPTNGRADDQERRNHVTQYISHPNWTWSRLRKETPSRYESYVDVVPGVWTRIKIDVRGDRARLYVHDQEQPALVVNDVKTGAEAKGAVGLWVGAGTVAHFRSLKVQPHPTKASQ